MKNIITTTLRTAILILMALPEMYFLLSLNLNRQEMSTTEVIIAVTYTYAAPFLYLRIRRHLHT